MSNQDSPDIRQVWQLPRQQKGKLLAAILSVYADHNGHFGDTPKRLLQGALRLQRPHMHYNDHEGLAVGIVNFLREEGWIWNKDTVSGRAGNWYLDLKRLGGRNDAIRRAQAAAVVAEMWRNYDDHMIGLIMAALREGRP